MLFQSSKLKARTSLFTETWQKRRSSFELSKMSPQVGLAVHIYIYTYTHIYICIYVYVHIYIIAIVRMHMHMHLHIFTTHCHTLHFNTLHCNTLHCNTLHCNTLHCNTGILTIASVSLDKTARVWTSLLPFAELLQQRVKVPCVLCGVLQCDAITIASSPSLSCCNSASRCHVCCVVCCSVMQ